MSQTSPQTDKASALRRLSLAVMSCGRCPYGKIRTIPVNGDGEPRSPILVVGEAVRQTDHAEEVPFGGRSGKKLDALLERAEINPHHVYRTLCVRCYGGREPEFPVGAASKRCRPHLVATVKIMRPRVMVLCGMRALKWVLLRWTNERVDDKTFSKWVGPAFRLKEIWGDIKLFVIHSPADMARTRMPDEEDRCVEALSLMKQYVVSQQQQSNTALPFSDLYRRRGGGRQAQFKWSNPGELVK